MCGAAVDWSTGSTGPAGTPPRISCQRQFVAVLLGERRGKLLAQCVAVDNAIAVAGEARIIRQLRLADESRTVCETARCCRDAMKMSQVRVGNLSYGTRLGCGLPVPSGACR